MRIMNSAVACKAGRPPTATNPTDLRTAPAVVDTSTSVKPKKEPEPEPVEQACRHCGYIVPNNIRWQACAGGDSRHLRLECGGCGRWKRFVPQTTEAISKADLQGGLA